MKHTYQVLDMSCGGCEANVKKALLALPDVHKVEIDLATKVVIIGMPEGGEPLFYKVTYARGRRTSVLLIISLFRNCKFQ